MVQYVTAAKSGKVTEPKNKLFENATDMKNLVKELMQKFIKPDVLSNAKSVVKLPY